MNSRLAIAAVACLALLPGAAWAQKPPGAAKPATQIPGADTPKSDATAAGAATPSVATADCTGALTAARINLPGGLAADKTCAALITAVQTTLTPITDSPAAKKIIYSEEAPKFYAALGKSLKTYGGKDPVVVSLAGAGAPVVTLNNIQAAAAPEYREIGLGVWLDRIEDAKGNLCKKPVDRLGAASLIAPYVFDFFAKAIVPWAIKKYQAATAYAPAKKLDALVLYTSVGDNAGRITEIQFVPRGSAGGCS